MLLHVGYVSSESEFFDFPNRNFVRSVAEANSKGRIRGGGAVLRYPGPPAYGSPWTIFFILDPPEVFEVENTDLERSYKLNFGCEWGHKILGFGALNDQHSGPLRAILALPIRTAEK